MRTLVPMLAFQFLLSAGLGLADDLNGWIRAAIYVLYVAVCVVWAMRVFRPPVQPVTT
jgi:hypothetical protein